LRTRTRSLCSWTSATVRGSTPRKGRCGSSCPTRRCTLVGYDKSRAWSSDERNKEITRGRQACRPPPTHPSPIGNHRDCRGSRGSERRRSPTNHNKETSIISTPQKELISNQQVRAFLDEPRKMLINGEWVDSASGKTFQSFNPATGGVLAEVAEGAREDINRAGSAAPAAFDGGPRRRMTPSPGGTPVLE